MHLLLSQGWTKVHLSAMATSHSAQVIMTRVIRMATQTVRVIGWTKKGS